MDDVLDTTPDVSLDDIAYYLGDARYPETREDLIYDAQMARATVPVMNILEQLPAGIYHTWDEVAFYLRKILNS